MTTDQDTYDADSCDYLLGTCDAEANRLNVQHNYLRNTLLQTFDKIPFLNNTNMRKTTHYNVLDIGFGTGAILGELFEHYGDSLKMTIHGIDNQERWHNYILANSPNLVKQINLGNLILHKIDINQTNKLISQTFGNITFDLIIVRFVLSFCDTNCNKILEALFENLLKNNKSFLIVCDINPNIKQHNGCHTLKLANDDKFIQMKHQYPNLVEFSDNFCDYYQNCDVCWNVALKLQCFVDNYKQTNLSMVWKHSMLVGGKHGSTGHTYLRDHLLVHLVDVVHGLGKISDDKRDNIKQEMISFFNNPQSVCYLWESKTIVIEKGKQLGLGRNVVACVALLIIVLCIIVQFFRRDH